jgi:hypothetical protein
MLALKTVIYVTCQVEFLPAADLILDPLPEDETYGMTECIH